MVFYGGSVVKNPPAGVGDTDLIFGLGRSPEEGNGKPLQYSCLGNPTDRGTWWSIIHKVAKELDTIEQLNLLVICLALVSLCPEKHKTQHAVPMAEFLTLWRILVYWPQRRLLSRESTLKAKQMGEPYSNCDNVCYSLLTTCCVPGTVLYTLHLTFSITLWSLRIHQSFIHLFNTY